jgi:hypothetical protein
MAAAPGSACEKRNNTENANKDRAARKMGIEFRPGGLIVTGSPLAEVHRELISRHCVAIRPLLVATIQRLPQRTIESIFPKPGTMFPRVTFTGPLGPSKITVPPITSETSSPEW